VSLVIKVELKITSTI